VENSELRVQNESMPLAEDLARREKTPFVMTSTGHWAKGALGWETGQRNERLPMGN